MTTHCATRLVVGVAVSLVAMSCAVQTLGSDGEAPSVTDSASAQPLPPAQPPTAGDSRCEGVLRLDAQGHLYVKEYLCPVPDNPLPDPERASQPRLSDPRVKGRIQRGAL